MNPLDYLCRLRELNRHLHQRRKRLHRIAFAWCRSRTLADDLVQETFVKALANLKQLREPKAVDAWLYHILHNCWYDFCRRERVTEDIDALAEERELAHEARVDQLDIVERVRAALGRLPEGQREVLTLVDIEGFSYGEVASILDIPTGTVTSRISRARETLRAELAELVSESEVKLVRFARAAE